MPIREESEQKGLAIYERIISRRRLVTLFALLAILPLFMLDVCVGPSPIGLVEVIKTLLGEVPSSSTTAIIVWDVRLPVATAALCAGAALGLAGLLMQTILDNPLASPYTLGISSAAAFGAALVYVLGVKVFPALEIYAVPINAMVFAFLACWLVYSMSWVKGFTSEALVLAGIAISFLFHALLAFMEYMASEEALQAIVFWIFGSLYKATWSKLIMISAVLIPSIILSLYAAWKLETLRLGDEVALSLGVNVKRVRALAFALSALLTAVAVCFFGIIGFVGLVAPHIARILVGEDHRFLIPCSAVMGAIILSAASTACKTLKPGAVIPIGIVTSFIGVPFFVALIITKKRRYW